MKLTHAGMLGIPFAGLMLLAATPASAATNHCDVEVNRGYADGTYEVTKQVMPNKDCVCYVQTGRDPQAALIEQKIVSLRRLGSCNDAVVMAIPAGSKAVAGTTAGIHGFSLIAPLAATAAVSATVIASSGDNGPSSP